jgi:DMSO/TMAO reductase YedYZ molybdopterin-dependent catalytic subunit
MLQITRPDILSPEMTRSRNSKRVVSRIGGSPIDMADALHPQTYLAYGMNGGDLSVGNGGPLRMRVPRQLGYKNVKFITRLA